MQRINIRECLYDLAHVLDETLISLRPYNRSQFIREIDGKELLNRLQLQCSHYRKEIASIASGYLCYGKLFPGKVYKTWQYARSLGSVSDSLRSIYTDTLPALIMTYEIAADMLCFLSPAERNCLMEQLQGIRYLCDEAGEKGYLHK